MGDMVLLNAAESMSVVDVYDLASDIGKECEKIIDLFGSDSVTLLMPKVINVLELLEAMATRNESENTKLQELNDRIAHLESEKHERAMFRERYQKELEDIEEQWRTESNDLVALVSRLQEENRRYQKQQSPSIDGGGIVENSSDLVLTTTTSTSTISGDSSPNLSTNNDFQLLQRLRCQIDKQRNELKTKDNELQAKIGEVENFSIQIERLTNAGRESRKRQKLLQVQVRSLVEERADFLAQLQDQHREIITLRKRLGITEKENEDLSKCQEENSNCARFSTAELKEILNERDDLKTMVSELQEELKLYKPPDVKDDDSSRKDVEKNIEEDPPVQGPLPYEPDDAPWKKNSSESGIRKFFRKLFLEPGTTSFSRRSLSTLSKMALSTSPGCDNY